MKLSEFLTLTEQWPNVTSRVAGALRREFDATFTNDAYIDTAAWLISPRPQRPSDKVQRVINMFKKLHSQPIDDQGARNLMYQEFVTNTGLGKDVYRATQDKR